MTSLAGTNTVISPSMTSSVFQQHSPRNRATQVRVNRDAKRLDVECQLVSK